MAETKRIAKPDGSFVETSTMQQCSIKHSRNAKGEVSYEVKTYEDDLDLMRTKHDQATRYAEQRKAELEAGLVKEDLET